MAEQLDLTTPIVAPTRAIYQIRSLVLDWAGAEVRAVVTGNDGLVINAVYSGQAAIDLMKTLKKLVADGKLPAGTVSGTPS